MCLQQRYFHKVFKWCQRSSSPCFTFAGASLSLVAASSFEASRQSPFAIRMENYFSPTLVAQYLIKYYLIVIITMTRVSTTLNLLRLLTFTELAIEIVIDNKLKVKSYNCQCFNSGVALLCCRGRVFTHEIVIRN